jgi:hypothetical protein
LTTIPVGEVFPTFPLFDHYKYFWLRNPHKKIRGCEKEKKKLREKENVKARRNLQQKGADVGIRRSS